MKRYIAHSRGSKNYEMFEGYTRQDLKDNNYIIDCVVNENEYINKFNGNNDCVLEYFSNICNCKSKTFNKVNA